MKRASLFAAFLFYFLVPALASGAVKTVTIDWALTDTSGVTGYRMYYAYDISMTNKTLACETSDPTATSLTCSNINLERSPVYVVIAAIFPENELASTVKSQTFVTQITQVQDFKIETVPTSTPPPPVPEYKLTWSMGTDSIDMPSNKTAKRTGNGKYIASGCYEGNCYDNVDTNSYISIPVINNDIINPNNFEISLYFNPKSLANYHYIFSIVSDINNAHKVHVYENGTVYCRTVLNGTKYYGYLDIPNITTGTWYKLTYSFSSNQIEISLNDTPAKTITTSDTFQGQISEIRLADSSTDGYSLNCLLDNITIK